MLQRIASLLRMQPPITANVGLLFGSGATVPPDTTVGYSKSCIFQHTDGAHGTCLYVNEGDAESSAFFALDVLEGDTAGSFVFADDAVGPCISTADGYDEAFIETGTYANTADEGIVVSATNNRPVSFLFDDGGNVFVGAPDIRAGLFRILLTVDQPNQQTLNALRAQIKALNGIDITHANSVTAPLTGYIEFDGAGARHLDGHVACVRAALETGAGAHTVDINLCGYESTLNSSGSFTADTLSAYVANISNGTTLWQRGLQIDADSCDTGVSIGATTGSALHISGKWGTGYNTAGILIAADQAGTALALGATTAGYQGIYLNLTATVTGGENLHGIYTKLSTAGAMVDGFIIGNYTRVNIDHVGYENYAVWGRMNVTVAQTGDTGNQYIGVFGSVGFAAGAHALAATGGGYGVQGTASIASGGTLDQPLLGGYFECNAVDNIAGLTCASRHRMLGYCDYGVDVLIQSNNNVAAIRIAPEDSAVVAVGISFEVAAGSGKINHIMKLEDSTNCGVNTSGNVAGNQASDALIKIDVGGTDYYLAAYVAGSVTGEWADA